jgi:hypothetical protein
MNNVSVFSKIYDCVKRLYLTVYRNLTPLIRNTTVNYDTIRYTLQYIEYIHKMMASSQTCHFSNFYCLLSDSKLCSHWEFDGKLMNCFWRRYLIVSALLRGILVLLAPNLMISCYLYKISNIKKLARPGLKTENARRGKSWLWS